MEERPKIYRSAKKYNVIFMVKVFSGDAVRIWASPAPAASVSKLCQKRNFMLQEENVMLGSLVRSQALKWKVNQESVPNIPPPNFQLSITRVLILLCTWTTYFAG